MNIPHRILVVDDEPFVTRSCRRILTEAGYEVDTVESGLEGMSRALDGRFDLVVTDLKMPDLDGMELVRSLRAKRPATAIVVITGYATVPSAVEATKLGVSDYVEKPFTPDQLMEAANRAMESMQDTPRSKAGVQADLVREVLKMAARNPNFGTCLWAGGSRVLSGYALSPEAKSAIVSGDIAWIEKECGELTAEERQWLDRRLEAESW
jgi:DNA-binding NtrC family response regulator